MLVPFGPVGCILFGVTPRSVGLQGCLSEVEKQFGAVAGLEISVVLRRPVVGDTGATSRRAYPSGASVFQTVTVRLQWFLTRSWYR
jgi:hypothetical protein